MWIRCYVSKFEIDEFKNQIQQNAVSSNEWMLPLIEIRKKNLILQPGFYFGMIN